MDAIDFARLPSQVYLYAIEVIAISQLINFQSVFITTVGCSKWDFLVVRQNRH